ncbi:endo-1,3;1,4-beta-D-glucanase-like [Humulus lupulus]|uniref:endo-1,3;1,4-beta-D-glucanase-like n=1 Tax=Humulus lupulus TaxID=3486 RepID=UPI002B411E67|nr:endo-1,3;1,4-beta-D-glucanase-like [Humulus lupulus]
MSSSECFENPPTLLSSTSSGVGTVQDVGGLKSYVTGSPHSNRAILFVSDVFGYEAPKLRKLADKLAVADQFLVVVPDFFYGDPLDLNNPDRDGWLKAHNMEKGHEDAKQVVAALKSKGLSAIGAAGFCWGGNVVVKLAGSTDIQAAVVLHPGHLTDEDINEVKVHIAILGAERDKIAPQEHIKHLGEILSAKSEFDSFVKIFPGVAHGWTVRYNDEDPFSVNSAEESHLDLTNWFTKYVK